MAYSIHEVNLIHHILLLLKESLLLNFFDNLNINQKNL